MPTVEIPSLGTRELYDVPADQTVTITKPTQEGKVDVIKRDDGVWLFRSYVKSPLKVTYTLS